MIFPNSVFSENSNATPCQALRLETKKEIAWFTERYSHENTKLIYLNPLNGPKGVATLESPENIQKGYCKGRFLPWGYGSGIEDVNLYTAQLLVALREVYVQTQDPGFAKYLRYYFEGLRCSASVSGVKGFVPRGPHPDGKSYYTDPSRDQVSSHIYGLWAYFRSGVATDEEKSFIKERIQDIFERLEAQKWIIFREDGITKAYVGESWLSKETHAAATLLPALAMAYDITGDVKWMDYYNQYAPDMWPYLDPAEKFKFAGHPLYIYQQLYKLIVFEELVEKIEPARKNTVVTSRLAWAEAMINIEYPNPAGQWSVEHLKELGWASFPTNAFEASDLIKPEYFDRKYRNEHGISARSFSLVMATFRFSVVNMLAGCLSGNADLIRQSDKYMQNLLGKVDVKTFDNATFSLVEILYRLQKLSE